MRVSTLAYQVCANEPARAKQIDPYAKQIHELSRLGVDGRGKRVGYISLEELQKYWTRTRVQEMCDSYAIISNWELIRSDYLRVFSTLVSSGRVAMIRHFMQYGLHDGVFPSDYPLRGWPDASPFSDCSEDFAEHQWTFFPLIIPFPEAHDRRLPERQIIPIKRKDPIQEGLDTRIYKIELDPQCNGLPPVRFCCTLILFLQNKYCRL